MDMQMTMLTAKYSTRATGSGQKMGRPSREIMFSMMHKVKEELPVIYGPMDLALTRDGLLRVQYA